MSNPAINGTENDDDIFGSETNDAINGLGGNDSLYGRGGDDTLSGGEGNDDLYGEEGSDTLFGDDGNDDLYGGAGNDVLSGDADNDDLYGGAGADNLSGGSGEDDLYGGEGNDYLDAGDGHDTAFGGDGNDWLEGRDGHDVLRGGNGTDRLYGGRGDDILSGGGDAANNRGDFLDGGAGNDTYLYESGDGYTAIYNHDLDHGSRDVLRFGEGINPSDIKAVRGGDSLFLLSEDGSEAVNLMHFFYTPSPVIDHGSSYENYFEIEAVEFADGTVWDTNTLKIMASENSEGDDYLYGDENDNVIDGLGGNDLINGGAGNDTLSGGEGSDAYVFEAGSGADTVFNYDTSANSTDIARFDNASISDLWFSTNGNDLQITVAGTDDQVTIDNWNSGEDYQLDEIQVNGSVLMNNQVDQLVAAMAVYDVPSGAGNVIPQDVKDALQPVLAEAWQSTV